MLTRPYLTNPIGTPPAISAGRPANSGTVGARVSLDRVQRRFGDVVAVDDASFDVSPGEFFTLLGPSGSGKTTLLQLLAGFLSPDRGLIKIDDREVSNLPPFKRDIGVVFQSYALFPNMSVFENVAFPLRVRRVDREKITRRVRQALDLVQLSGLEARKPHQLSGGQQQRVAFARATAFEPRLLLMDEPLSALDAKLRRSMRVEIKELQRTLGVTVIYVTHDQDEALALSDRVAVINRGVVEQIDSPSDLYEHPNSRFVADFLGEANVFEGKVIGKAGPERFLVDIGSSTIEVRSSSALAPDTAVAVAVRPERLRIDPPEHQSNSVEGTVVAKLYGGDHVLVRIDVGGKIVSAKLSSERGGRLVTEERLRIGWQTEHGTLLVR
jgi:putative spermidine/putrescine transport system ATP-binding protein